MDSVFKILEIYLPIVVIIVTFALNRRKFNAEIEAARNATKGAREAAEISAAKGKAEIDRIVSDTALSLTDRMAARLQEIEEQYDTLQQRLREERCCNDEEKEKLRTEIKVLEKQLEKAEVDCETSRAKLSAALDLARRYRLIAINLHQQLIEEGLVPRQKIDIGDIKELLAE